jgi:mono/diheme cytochrome c family protein
MMVALAGSVIAPATVMVAEETLGAKDVLPAGSVSQADGLAAWNRIEAVITHPRCANCHVDEAGIPLWTPAGETKTRPHGMNIHAGISRIGAESIACSTCHVTSALPNPPAPAPPHAGIDWQLAPVEFLWVGKTGAEICAQLKDPERNGGRDVAGLIEHLRHDASLSGFIPRAWEPGEGRSTPPGTFEEHVKDVAEWGAAGQPCPK